MYGEIAMATDMTKRQITILSRTEMIRLLETKHLKYDAKKAAKEARKNLRKQGLKV